MRLKRWESPRREGRNDKGKGGAARQRQLKKRQQQLRRKLKGNPGEEKAISSFFLLCLLNARAKYENWKLPSVSCRR